MLGSQWSPDYTPFTPPLNKPNILLPIEGFTPFILWVIWNAAREEESHRRSHKKWLRMLGLFEALKYNYLMGYIKIKPLELYFEEYCN